MMKEQGPNLEEIQVGNSVLFCIDNPFRVTRTLLLVDSCVHTFQATSPQYHGDCPNMGGPALERNATTKRVQILSWSA